MAIINPTPMMWKHRGQTLNHWGKDHTGLINYRFNDQGFRGDRNYDYGAHYAFFGCSLVFGVGVSDSCTFANHFENSHNYGLAGQYNNADILQTVQDFLIDDTRLPITRIAVFWTDRDAQHLREFWSQLKSVPMLHFFCGDSMSDPGCFKMPTNLDFDVSGTHMGPKSHQFMAKILENLWRTR